MVENDTIFVQIPIQTGTPNANGDIYPKEVVEKALKKYNAKAKSRVQVKCPKCEHSFLPSIEEVQSRAGASSRRKGHGFERLVAKKLQKWWNQDGKYKYEFKRTPQSGGSSLKQGWGLAGDIATTATNWPYHVECKNAPGSFKGLHQFFSAEKFVFWDWLVQCRKDCPEGKRIVVIFNRFDQPTWCACPHEGFIGPVLDKMNVGYFKLVHRAHGTLYIWTLDDMLLSTPEGWV